MQMPFFRELTTTHVQPKVTSYTSKELLAHPLPEIAALAPDINELQTYASSGNRVQYEAKLAELALAGHSCRSTKGKVYLARQEAETVDVKVAVQVKGHSLTWYFWAENAMDQYPQAFRDLLYNKAAECHRKVTAGCDLYYRGSNAIHIKMMHHHESESNHNHNHYRLKDNKHYTPADFNQHLQAFKGWELEQQFFAAGEIDQLCEEFKGFHAQWTAKDEHKQSKEEEYFSQPSQQLDTGDMIELKLFGTMQEPCRLSVDELEVDYEAARKAIEAQLANPEDSDALLLAQKTLEAQYKELLDYRVKGGSRGLNASIASMRQVHDSANQVIRAKQRMDDRAEKEVPDIPEWAHALKAAINHSQEQMLSLANKRHTPGIAQEDIAREWADTAKLKIADIMAVAEPASAAAVASASEKENLEEQKMSPIEAQKRIKRGVVEKRESQVDVESSKVDSPRNT